MKFNIPLCYRVTFLNAQRAHRSPTPDETPTECNVQLWFVFFTVIKKKALTIIYLDLLIRKYVSQCLLEKNPLKELHQHSWGHTPSSNYILLSRLYRHLLRSPYYVWLNKCSHFNYIEFNLVIMWVSEIAAPPLYIPFMHVWIIWMLQLQMSVEREKFRVLTKLKNSEKTVWYFQDYFV